MPLEWPLKLLDDRGSMRPVYATGNVLCLWISALSACMGHDSPAANAAGSGGVAAVLATLLAQIQALEASGALPALDRSTDIKGPDANNNGVRDDIEAWIASLPITETQKKAAMQSARASQRALLVDLMDAAALQSLGNLEIASTVCIKDSFIPDRPLGSVLSSKIEAMTANTRERARRYLDYNKAVSGSATSLPEGNTCEP